MTDGEEHRGQDFILIAFPDKLKNNWKCKPIKISPIDNRKSERQQYSTALLGAGWVVGCEKQASGISAESISWLKMGCTASFVQHQEWRSGGRKGDVNGAQNGPYTGKRKNQGVFLASPCNSKHWITWYEDSGSEATGGSVAAQLLVGSVCCPAPAPHGTASLPLPASDSWVWTGAAPSPSRQRGRGSSPKRDVSLGLSVRHPWASS